MVGTRNLAHWLLSRPEKMERNGLALNATASGSNPDRPLGKEVSMETKGDCLLKNAHPCLFLVLFVFGVLITIRDRWRHE